MDLVTFTEEILNGKLHFLCSGGKISPNRTAVTEASTGQDTILNQKVK